MPDLLLEIGTEEIPARFIHHGLSFLGEGLSRLLKDRSIKHGEIIGYSTPRRLTVYIKDISERQDDRTIETIGPPRKVAFDSKGNPTDAAKGFARSQNVDVTDLRVVRARGGEYVAAILKKEGRTAREILSEEIPKVISSIPFPRSMRWGSGSLRFVRPIRWILTLLGSELLVFEMDGIRSDRLTYGHRFLSHGAIRVEKPSDYPSILRDNHVIACFEERKNLIIRQMEMLECERDIKIHRDKELLETVTNLVEYPTVVLGEFEDRYLSLPRDLLITVMRAHQKYFYIEDKAGNLLPEFVVVSNTLKENNDIVRKGSERVLRARLEDARFYFDEDRKIPIWDYVERLHKVTFHEELGNLFEKVERIASIGSFIADQLGFEPRDKLLRAAMLSKADLVTGIVREFPELQGYMGMIYALHSGEDQDVAIAIHEHYLPRFHGDKLPSSEIGSILSIADKMDNIAAAFFLGLIPSGSEDPFALRRQATGIINIFLNKEYPIPLKTIVERSIRNLEDYTPSIKKLRDEIMRLFLQRFEGIYLSQGIGHDVIDAVSIRDDMNIKEMKRGIERLTELKKDPRFTVLLTAVKRVYNILSKAHPQEVKENLLSEPEERRLYKESLRVRDALREDRLEALFDLVDPINHFFDRVLVMDKRQEVRTNRLALLYHVKGVFENLGDLSRLSPR